MKKSLKPLLCVLVLVMSVSLIMVFSLGGCRRVEELVVEPVMEELVVEEAIEEAQVLLDEAATEAVVTAEAAIVDLSTKVLVDTATGLYNTANGLVTALPEGTVKDDLTARLVVVEEAIEEAQVLLAATEAVVTAEVVIVDLSTKVLVDTATGLYNTANGLVAALPEGTVKDDLTARLAVVEEAIEEAQVLLDEAAEEPVEEMQPTEEITTQVPQSPSKTTYLNNIGNIINEYNMVINHWNTYEKDYNDLGSYIEFDKAILNKIGEINSMLQNITPASGYEGAQTHFIDLANNLYSYIQQEINYLEDKNFDESINMTNNFNNTFNEFINYYNSL